MKLADWQYFQLQWIEWSGSSIPTSKLLPATSTTPLFVGNYNSSWQFPNPIKTLKVTNGGTELGVDNTPTFVDKNKRAWNVSPGELLYFPNRAGPYQNTATAKKDYNEIKALVDEYNMMSREYNIAVTAHNKLATKYNSMVTKEKARRASPFKLMTEAPWPVPQVPCLTKINPGSWATDWFGRKMITASQTFATDPAKHELYTFNYNGGVMSETVDFKAGYMQTSTNEAGTTTTEIDGVQHTFGLLGQKTGVTLTDVSAFRWKVPTAEDDHYMMVSIFPYD